MTMALNAKPSGGDHTFPLSAGAALIKRAAIPIWLISEASSRYKDLYKEAAKDANKLLNMDNPNLRAGQ